MRASPLAAINLIITVIKSIGILIKYTVKPEHLLGVLKHLAGGMQSGMQPLSLPKFLNAGTVKELLSVALRQEGNRARPSKKFLKARSRSRKAKLYESAGASANHSRSGSFFHCRRAT